MRTVPFGLFLASAPSSTVCTFARLMTRGSIPHLPLREGLTVRPAHVAPHYDPV